MKNHLGHQTMLELYNCKPEFLNDIEFIKEALLEAARVSNATIVNQYFHQFSPFGVSGTVIITESHINIHTWPEYNYVAIDIFSCTEDMEIEKACEYLTSKFEASKNSVQKYMRGDKEMIKQSRGLKTPSHHL